MGALSKLIACSVEFKLDEIDGKALLFYAAKNNLWKMVEKLHFKNFDLNITDDEGKTAVFYANRNHGMHALSMLIKCDVEFKLDEIDGKAVLFCAAKNNWWETVQKLHFKNFDLNITDDEGKTAVFYANHNRSMRALSMLIKCDVEFKLDEIDGKAVLFCAAKNNWWETVQKLHFRNFDLNIIDDNAKTAVFYANYYHNVHALSMLIKCDADFEWDEIDGKAVLFCAAKNNWRETVKALYCENFDLNTTDAEGKTAVFYANRYLSMDALSELIECDVEFKLDEIDGKALLFCAAKNNWWKTVQKLRRKNLDLNITDAEGKTAVFYANRNHSMDVLCALICWGGKFKLDDIDGKAVLFYAAKNNLRVVVKPLYDAGLNLNITDEQGKTVVFYGKKDFLDALMKMVDVVIDARDHHGRTPLFYALGDGDTTKARYLIENGANLQLKDNCDVSIFTFFIETCISKNLEAIVLFTSQLLQGEPQRKALIHAIFNILYCQAPLLSLKSFSHLLKSYAIFNETNVLEALAFAREEYVNQDSDKVENIDKVVQMIKEKVTDVAHIISLLINLGADPQTTDSDGNTAFHYATLLPLYGVTQEVVMDICGKLQRFGTIFHAKNHQHQSPLLFCLSSNTWKVVFENNSWQSSIRGLVEVCRFLLSSRNVMTNSEVIFHRIISLIQHGLNLNEKSQRKTVVQVLVDILELLQPHQSSVRNAVNYADTLLNSPLHLWASIALKSPQDYTGFGTEDFTFERILRIILNHLLKCGAKCNARNADEETPLHTCRTWTAVELLVDAGANPKVQNSSGYSPLLTAAKKKNASQKTEHLYSDVTKNPESFWKCALLKGLDPWVAGKEGETIFSVLVKSEDFPLTRALVKVACEEESTTDNDKLSILNVICNDEAKHINWKTNLVDIILQSTGTNRLALESPLCFCCQNIVKFGMFEDMQLGSVQQKANDEPGDDNWQPPTKKSRKDEPEKKEEEKQESEEEEISNDSVYCKIAKRLFFYRRDIDITAIANKYPSLKDFLENLKEIHTIDRVIPWTSVSCKHKVRLTKVASKVECESVDDKIWYHSECIGSGSFGHIFAGINEKDGREVAVKRVEKLRLKRPEFEREIKNLIALSDCEHVVRYIFFSDDQNFFYLYLELMEGNLEELMEGNLEELFDGDKIDPAIHLCKHVVMGLQFLHQQRILHRDLKPQNILYKIHPKLCLKIADFGLSRPIDNVGTTVYGTLAGTRRWIAPEVLTSKPNSLDKDRFATESDVFSCGMILHYIHSGGKHPFSPNDFTNMNSLQVSHETEANIMNGKMDGWDDSLCPEATHLVKKMLEKNEKDRPTATEALKHPLFWSNEMKLQFLKVVGNQKEFEEPRGKRPSFTAVENDLDSRFHTIVKRTNWNNFPNMNSIYKTMRVKRDYVTSSAVELVRFIRNTCEHYRDNTFLTPTRIGHMLFTDFVFLKHFPDLVIEVYKAVITHGWDQTRDDIKCFLDDIDTR